MTTILCAIFFLSGASALIFEVLWFQLSGLTFGNSIWATSIVLASFMGGLALGSGLAAFWGHKIKSPIRLYAFLEIAIAISGFSLVFVFPKLTQFFVPLFRPFLDQIITLNSLRAIIAVLLMLVPATAMGATLPILVKALYAEKPNFGRVLGILYGWNTLGAMAGIITCELFFVKWFGIRGAGLIAATFNMFAAGMAILLSKKNLKTNASEQSEKLPFFSNLSSKTVRFLAASFISGFTLLALEVIWFRFMILFFVAHSRNFAAMLAMVLSGISLGGLFASKLFRLKSDANRLLIPFLFLNGIFIIVLYSNFGFVLDMFEKYGEGVRISFVSLFLMFPVSFVSGAIFTMLGKELHTEIKAETRSAGMLTLVNTTGGMLGSIIAGLVFIPFFGIEKSFFLLALAYGAGAFIIFDKKQFAQQKTKIPFHYLAAGTFFVSLAIFPFNMMNQHYLEISSSKYIKGTGAKKVAIREGLTETIQYLQKDLLGEPYYHILMTNNHSMSGTTLKAKRYMRLFAYWPVALHPGPKNALLICLGCGSTAKAMTDTKGLENIEIVDISRDIVEMSSIVFPDPKENPVNDPRVKIHIEDGRFFLLTTKTKFDLITAEPPPPKHSGIVNLYTQEYFQLIYDRLSEGGIVTYWLPVYQLKISESKSILRGFCNVFKNCSLWTGAGFEWMMVGVKNPKNKVSEKEFIRQWNDPVVAPEMRALGLETPEQFGSLFIADGQRLRNWISDTLPLVDNFPRRLSYGSEGWRQNLPVYREFMNHELSTTNFMESEDIQKRWPGSLRRKAERYFSVRNTINDMLAPTRRMKNLPLVNLNKCIHNPLLANYALWSLRSDQFAQRIISRELKDKPLEHRSNESLDIVVILTHLAAHATQQRNYMLAEKYLHLATDNLKSHKIFNKYYSYCIYRMYLLFISGDKKRAFEVGQEYVNLRDTGKDKRKRQIDKYWNWLVNIVGSSPD